MPDKSDNIASIDTDLLRGLGHWLEILADPVAAKARLDAVMEATGQHETAMAALKVENANLEPRRMALNKREEGIIKREAQLVKDEAELKQVVEKVDAHVKAGEDREAELKQLALDRNVQLGQREDAVTAREQAVADKEEAVAKREQAAAATEARFAAIDAKLQEMQGLTIKGAVKGS